MIIACFEATKPASSFIHHFHDALHRWWRLCIPISIS